MGKFKILRSFFLWQIPTALVVIWTFIMFGTCSDWGCLGAVAVVVLVWPTLFVSGIAGLILHKMKKSIAWGVVSYLLTIFILFLIGTFIMWAR